MTLHTWCFFASALLVGAEIYDKGPQTFFESSSPAPQSKQSASREFILYLTPSQANALEYSGALVRLQPGTETERAQNEEPQVAEEQRGSQSESDNSEDDQKEDSDSGLEEIFKILNQQKIHVLEQREEEQGTDKPQEIPTRFNFLKLQQEGKKYLAPTEVKELGPATSYSYVRFFQPSEDFDELKPKPYLAQPPSPYTFESSQEPAEQQEETRPEEAPESDNQEDNTSSLLQHRKIAARIFEHRNRLLKNELELQSKLRDLQDPPSHNRHAIESKKLRFNFEKQNVLFKAEDHAKSAPVMIKEEIIVDRDQRHPVEVVKVPAPTPVIVHVPEPFDEKVPQPYAVQLVRPTSVTLVKTENNEVQKPVLVEAEKGLPVTNVYVKVNKPYLVERIAPVQSNGQIPVEGPFHKPEKLTIVRHIWEH